MVVVGGGLAGLVAATVAARAGCEVVLLEARSVPGGRARTVERGGYLLNEGAHALYQGGEALPILRRLGVEPVGGIPPTKGTMGIRGGRLGLLPVGAASLAVTDLLGVRGKLRLARVLAALPRIDTAELGSQTIGAWAEREVPEPDARSVLHAVVRLTTYSDDPDHLSADAALLQVQRATAAGVLYLHGGWQTLVDGLRAGAVAAGVELRTGCKVDRLVPVADGVRTVVDGRSLLSGAVVVTAGGPGGLLAVLDDPSEQVRSWARAARPSRAACLDVGLGQAWGDGPGFAIGIDTPLYVSEVTRAAHLAPEGSALASVIRYLDPDDVTEPEADRRQLEEGLDLLRPGWRDVAEEVVFRPRLVAATDVPKAETGGLGGRPGPEVPGAARVFVAGDWVGGAGLLVDAALASAEVAGERAALERRGVMMAT